jgi:hypothetical protein
MKKIISLVGLSICFLHASSQNVVVSSNPTTNDRFSKKSGNLRMSNSIVKIGKIKSNESRTDTLRVYNDAARTMTLGFAKIPKHMLVKSGADSLLPKMETWIAVTYDAAKRNDYGYVLDRFEITTNDSMQPKKPVSISAYIIEYFPVMSAEDSANVQKAKWQETTYNYGKIKKGDRVAHKFFVTNEGKRDLYIRKTTSNCICMKTIEVTDTIAPGKTGFVNIEFDSSNKEGKDSRRMTVFLSDPAKPEVMLELKGEIEK